jgi:hypothetical protein
MISAVINGIPQRINTNPDFQRPPVWGTRHIGP